MEDPVELFCEYWEDDQIWAVYFNRPFGGIYLLETFENEADARAFFKEQIDNADFGDE